MLQLHSNSNRRMHGMPDADQMCVYTYIYIYIYTCIYTYILYIDLSLSLYIYIYIYIYIYNVNSGGRGWRGLAGLRRAVLRVSYVLVGRGARS